MSPVVTLTLNPSLDQVLHVDRVEPDRKLRTTAPRYDPGGGGINVARAVAELGGAAIAVYPSGGPTGEHLRQVLKYAPCEQHRVPIAGTTRLNPNVFEVGHGEAPAHGDHHTQEQIHTYRFLLPGPKLEPEELKACIEAALGLLEERSATFFVLSGSLPEGAPADTYGRLSERAGNAGFRVIVDASGPALREAVGRGAYLLKPNLRELRQLTGADLEDDDAIRDAAVALVEQRAAEVVLVSLGGGGATVAARNRQGGLEHGRIFAPTVPIRSRIGAGDSTVAGTTVALHQGAEPIAAARYGVAAGAAAVMREGTELCRREDVERLFAQLDAPRPFGGEGREERPH